MKFSSKVFIPPSPWIGSINIAAIVSFMELFNSSRLFRSIFTNPCNGSPKPSRCELLFAAAIVPRVLPWKDPLKVMILDLSFLPLLKWYLLAAFIVHSTASAPELQKKTLSANELNVNFSASFCCPSIL